jgi:threonylcarbamoyladenosine tRNA methylthiotransferase MtaB
LRKTVSIITLGCKVNFTDSNEIAEALVGRGYSVVYDHAPADVSIVNTCTVTSRADYQSRQAIRRAARHSSGTPVIVTGCSSSVFPERIIEVCPSAVIIPPPGRGTIADVVSSLIGRPQSVEPELSARKRTRAFLKIQEGCNAGCTYCIVPRARGRETSVPPEDVLQRLAQLEEQGYKEIVLVGIHLGRYGSDMDGQRVSLARLLDLIGKSVSGARIRLSSIEPMELTDELLDAAAGSPYIADHLHVPVQSGDDCILEAMGRPYRRTDIEAIIRKVCTRFADPGIGVDILVGFPGEGDREFHNTIDLVGSLPVTYLHVFPYSRRPYTRAFLLEGQVSSAVKTGRARIARELGARKKEEYIRKNIDRTLTVLAESYDSGLVRGKSGNYLDVYFPGTPRDLNSFVPVTIERHFRGGAYGRRSV